MSAGLSARTTVPPQLSGPKISRMEQSKQIDVAARTRSRSSPNTSAAQCRRSTALAWVSAMPFGCPVEPEV
jgi:hypothetical protein